MGIKDLFDSQLELLTEQAQIACKQVEEVVAAQTEIAKEAIEKWNKAVSKFSS